MAKMTLRAIGTDDSVNTCDCCGKKNLKYTVVMVSTDGETLHYGSTCAARNSGKAPKQIRAEISAHEQALNDAAMDEYRAHPLYQQLDAIVAECHRQGLIGKEFVAKTRDTFLALQDVAMAIKARTGCTRMPH